MSDRRLRAAILALSLVGAGIAGYLTYAHFADVQLVCATGGCETVQHSRWSKLGGVPVAAIGLAGYVVLAATAASATDLARALGAAAAVGGFTFAAFLIWVQGAEIHAWCQWCLGSDAVLALIAVAAVARAWRAAPPGGASSRRAPRRPGSGRARLAAPARPRR
ncbi:MAG TPA: vitamin K epoxide reductase family protein [Gaiellaceae bacterium]|nr:vitamin K epoxide reductase family protein [Gaiellaceae bacterium]